MEPYKELIAQDKVDIIMTAHVFNKKLDAKYPSTLSKRIITDLLRTKMGYNGVVISDDMQMGAIAKHYSLSEALKLSINAGVDIMLVVQKAPYNKEVVTQTIELIRALVEKGEISAVRIDESYQRIQSLKQRLK